MPFMREQYFISTPMRAARFLIKELGFSPKLAQKTIDKTRFRLPDNTPIHKSQIISGEVWLTRFVDGYYSPSELIAPIFITKDFVVFNKPNKLLTHPKGTFTHKSLVDSIRAYCGTYGQPAHRLDYETSGTILVATTKQSEKILKNLLSTQQVKKLYLAKVKGILRDEILVNAPISTPHKRARGNLSIRSCISDLGKDSRTLLTPIYIDTAHNCTYIHARPITGRTHQIRLHCAYIGHPICGDLLYGAGDEIADSYLCALKDHFIAQSYAPQFSPESTSQATSPQNTFLAQTLCLHAFSLHFCYRSICYAISTPQPNWWITST